MVAPPQQVRIGRLAPNGEVRQCDALVDRPALLGRAAVQIGGDQHGHPEPLRVAIDRAGASDGFAGSWLTTCI